MRLQEANTQSYTKVAKRKPFSMSLLNQSSSVDGKSSWMKLRFFITYSTRTWCVFTNGTRHATIFGWSWSTAPEAIFYHLWRLRRPYRSRPSENLRLSWLKVWATFINKVSSLQTWSLLTFYWTSSVSWSTATLDWAKRSKVFLEANPWVRKGQVTRNKVLRTTWRLSCLQMLESTRLLQTSIP